MKKMRRISMKRRVSLVRLRSLFRAAFAAGGYLSLFVLVYVPFVVYVPWSCAYIL